MRICIIPNHKLPCQEKVVKVSNNICNKMLKLETRISFLAVSLTLVVFNKK